MTIKSNKTILNLFFYAFALIALTACGGSSGGGGSAGDTCDKSRNFCNLPDQPLRSACVRATHDCDGDGTLLPDHLALPTTITPLITYTPTDPTDMITTIDSATGVAYTDWNTAVIAQQTDEYNRAGGAANQIGAAYAYARGYTGEGVIVSQLGTPIDREHRDIAGQLVQGYVAPFYSSFTGNITVPADTTATAGTCAGAGDSSGGTCASYTAVATRYGSLIAGKRGNDGVQGIAYNAKIKPVSIITISGTSVNSLSRAVAIAEASGKVDATACTTAVNGGANSADVPACKTITVMNNGWGGDSFGGTFREAVAEGSPPSTTQYIYLTPTRFGSSNVTGDIATLDTTKIAAWRTATTTTVAVFAQGDYGYNSVNGMIRLHNSGFAYVKDVAWSVVNAAADAPISGDINLGGGHSLLPTKITELATTSLAVIALDENNVIYKYSNGCGANKAYCLGAPGVNVKSAIPGTDSYEVTSGTSLAAAHVSGAVAVLKSAFPTLTPAQLVNIILNTADYIGIDSDAEGKIDGTNEVYGHGKLNLAEATSPQGETMVSLPGALSAGARLDNSGITLPTSFGSSLNGFTVGFIDDYKRAYIGNPSRITRTNAAFTLADTIATWDSPELQSITLDSNSKMQFTNYDENADAKDTLIFTHNLPNHTVGFSYNEEHRTPDLSLAGDKNELHFQKIRPIANDLMQVNSNS